MDIGHHKKITQTENPRRTAMLIASMPSTSLPITSLSLMRSHGHGLFLTSEPTLLSGFLYFIFSFFLLFNRSHILSALFVSRLLFTFVVANDALGFCWS
jgi:hypothetical protein